MEDIAKYKVRQDDGVLKVIRSIDKHRNGTAIVVNEKNKLVGVITDGDIRRQMLFGEMNGKTAKDIMCSQPVTALLSAPKQELKDIMLQHRITSIPLLTQSGIPKKIVFLRNLIDNGTESQTAVIMAGGEGLRLRPLTENIPKPLLKVGGKSVLGNIIEQLAKAKIKDLHLVVNYKAEMISKYFKDGRKYGVKIQYIYERKKLGTAGGLTMLPKNISNPILLVNSDIVTKTDFNQLLNFHRQHYSALTVAAVQYNFRIPYGVLKLMGHYVLGIEEKPQQNFFCSAGIYVLNKEILRFIPQNQIFNITDLISTVIENGLPVSTFPIREQWVDIGDHQELRKARKEFNYLNKKTTIKRVRNCE